MSSIKECILSLWKPIRPWTGFIEKTSNGNLIMIQPGGHYSTAKEAMFEAKDAGSGSCSFIAKEGELPFDPNLKISGKRKK